MNDEIDRILSREDEILPSSGFAASVMEAVRREAAVPPPIPFPWKRALPCAVMAAVALALTSWVFVRALAQLSRGSGNAHSAEMLTSVLPIVRTAITPAIGWTVAALALALVSVAFSLRLGSRMA